MVSDINHQSSAGQPLITAGEQTFVRPLCTSTDRLQLNWQGPLNCVYDAWSIASKPLRRRLGVMIMYWSDCDGWPLRVYKWSSLPSRGIVQIWPSKGKGTMLSVALFYLVAVICSARRTHALPLYPDSNLEPQAGKTLSLISSISLKVLDYFRQIWPFVISNTRAALLLCWLWGISSAGRAYNLKMKDCQITDSNPIKFCSK